MFNVSAFVAQLEELLIRHEKFADSIPATGDTFSSKEINAVVLKKLWLTHKCLIEMST